MRVQIVLQRVALDKIQQYFRNWIWCILSLQWRHNECDGFANHRHLHCLLNRLFRHRSKKISKLHVTGLCGEFTGHPAQMASYAEDVSIWWRHHANCVMYNEHCQEDNGYALQSDSNWMANQTKCSHEVLISKLRNKFHRDWLSITCALNCFEGNRFASYIFIGCLIKYITDHRVSKFLDKNQNISKHAE